jgi:multicomponent K+:H+ antiporter subunit E
MLVDIIRSNFAVARIVLSLDRRDRHSGFVSIPLDLRDSYALAVLACIITSTPGTIWVDFNSSNRVLLIHVLDLIDEDAWVRTIKNRYAAGDFRMSAQTLLIWLITVAQILLVLAAACAVFRLLQGPRAQDRGWVWTRSTSIPLLIAAFVTVTTPVTLMLLVRAALFRDSHEGDAPAPDLQRNDGGR